jgi:hypothetical protein
MATTKRMKIEGKPVRPYNLYRIGLNDEIIELVVRADTLEEPESHFVSQSTADTQKKNSAKALP